METNEDSGKVSVGVSRSLSVLIVEDNADDIPLTVSCLERAGYEVRFNAVDTPERLRHCLETSQYDILITDHGLDGWTGLDVVEIIQASGRDLPVIVVTGTLGDEGAVDYIKRGAADFLLKENRARLARSVAQVLRERSSRLERQRLEEGILAANREWRLTFDAVPDPVLVIDTDCIIRRANRAAATTLGVDLPAIIGKPCWEVVHRREGPNPECPHQLLLASGVSERGDLVEPHLGRVFDATTSPIRDSAGVLRGCVHVLRDVTERKGAEVALRESERKYRELVDNATYGIFRSTPEGKFLDVNPALVGMLGYESADELLSMHTFADVLENSAELPKMMQALREGVGDGKRAEIRWKRKSGRSMVVRLAGRAVHDEQGRMQWFEGIAEDVTMQWTLETQLRQAQRMEAVGRLAGGIAHDFNNLLSVVLGYSDILLEQLPASEMLRGSVAQIKKAGDHAAALTRQLLAFSRQQVLEPKTLSLNSIVLQLGNLLRRLIGEDVALTTQLSPALGCIKADPSQIEQVLMNLAVNARDAMPNGGKLTIETANADLEEPFSPHNMRVPPGQYVMLAVSDNGVGMTEEIKSHIFEPFFTTKGMEKGTGLGLATVYGIVKQSAGYIWVYTEMGKGTTFKVYFPRVSGTGEAVAVDARAHAPMGGSETVLLVEDDAALRELNRKMLVAMGYSVLQAADGEEALRVAAQFDEPVHLLLTDVVMPGITGRDLADRLRALRPELKVLYVSGYTENVIANQGVLDANSSFLQKPFTRDDLAKRLRSVLGPPSTA